MDERLVMMGKQLQYLVEQGRTPDGVARLLYQEGIVGERVKVASCPLVNHIKRQDSSLLTVHVTSEYVASWVADGRWGAPLGLVEMDPVLREFVRNFDGGRYPYLDKNDRRRKSQHWLRYWRRTIGRV